MADSVMSNELRCSRCGATNIKVARFCARCGGSMSVDRQTCGRVPHPSPLAAPPGFRRCDGAADLCFQAKASGGGSVLLGTEGFEVMIFNGGYPLESVVMKVDGLNAQGQTLFSVELSAEQLPRGEKVMLELPSYEISEPARNLAVALVAAEYDS